MLGQFSLFMSGFEFSVKLKKKKIPKMKKKVLVAVNKIKDSNFYEFGMWIPGIIEIQLFHLINV